MLADTAAVIVGSAHCGGKWDGCANVSPMNVAMALIVACRPALTIVRSICAITATATAALTIPQTEARSACSKLNAANDPLRPVPGVPPARARCRAVRTARSWRGIVPLRTSHGRGV